MFLTVRVPETRGVLSQAVPLMRVELILLYWNPGLSRARLPVPPQGVAPPQHSPSLACKELMGAIQLCVQHSTMLRDLARSAH